MNNVTFESNPGDRALQQLMEGNRRYVGSECIHPNQSDKRRHSLLDGQHPYAIILSCSDSRVPPEIIFDQGLGDLFVIRVAGNVIDDIVLASIEYAAEHLHAPLLMVLGHTSCGAVQAALQEDDLDGHLPRLALAIEKAVEETKDLTDDVIDQTVKAHARITEEHLKNSKPVLKRLVESGELKVIAALYGLSTGIVQIL